MGAVTNLKSQLGDIPGIETLNVTFGDGFQNITISGRTIQVGAEASIEEIRQALNIQKIDAAFKPTPESTQKPMGTIAEQLKAARAQLAEARQGAANAVSECEDASRVVMQEVEKARKEAADLRAEVAGLTNGGPAL